MNIQAKPAPFEPGTVVGSGYRIIRKVATGGFGVIYQALDADAQVVAIITITVQF